MTTMAPNAMLMKAALVERAKLAGVDLYPELVNRNVVSRSPNVPGTGYYDLQTYQNNLLTGNFKRTIPHSTMTNPFAGLNYARWIDHVKSPQLVANMLYPKTMKCFSAITMRRILKKIK